MPRIVLVETLLVDVPTRREHKWAGLTEKIGRYLLVKLTDDDGRVGWGEAPALKDWGGEFGRYFGESTTIVQTVITNYLAPAVKGVELGDIIGLHARMDAIVKGYPYAKAAVEFAAIHALGSLNGEGIGKWLAARPVFVSTAIYEPFGLAVLEAALAGCPLVLSDIPTFRELWHDAALFVPPDNADEIAAALAALMADAPRRNQLARLARNRALAFTPQRMAQGYMALYQEMLSRPRSPAGARAESFRQIDSRFWP